MTDKELIQAMRCCDDHGCKDCPAYGNRLACDYEVTFGVAADRLEALLAENERLKVGEDTNAPTKWVSVEERLPRYNRDVLCYRPEMAMKVVVCSYDGYYGEDDNEWYEEWSNFGYDADGNCLITHWMPFPKPPSTEGVE